MLIEVCLRGKSPIGVKVDSIHNKDIYILLASTLSQILGSWREIDKAVQEELLVHRSFFKILQ